MSVSFCGTVVELHRFYQGPRDLVLMLERIPGGDLQQFLQRHGALAEHAVNAIMLQLAAALSHVHSCGGEQRAAVHECIVTSFHSCSHHCPPSSSFLSAVLHRDVKLENLLVAHPGPSPHIKLCDVCDGRRIGDC